MIGTDANHPVVTDEVDADKVACKQSLAAFEYPLEHRRGIRNRIADRGENLSRRALLIERFFGLVEQADVIDGDRGLIREGLQ